MVFADIILPLAQPVYTFAVDEGLHVVPGTAVAVQFGPHKIYTGLVWRVHDRRPDARRIKTVSRTLYDRPLLSPAQMRFWEWTADYYMCTLGEVMRAALPALMKPSGDTEEAFAEEEFRPRTEPFALLADGLRDERALDELFERLARRAPKQYEALLEIASAGPEGRMPDGPVACRLLHADRTILRTLARKGHIRLVELPRDDVRTARCAFAPPEPTPVQSEALAAVRREFAKRKPVLLHGVTGSGKTEIYIHLIAETLARGGDVLMLVPEIALTAQLIDRMERIFGSRVTPYHSKLPARKRTESYLRLTRSEGGEFVIGTRSALFLPLERLQLVVVDEEHDPSYKQSDPAPRYHARDCAVMLAHLTGSRIVLGSATPSLETWLLAESGKYGKAVLAERYGAGRPPQILLSDTLRAAKRGERRAHFNKQLLDRIGAALAGGRQVMLFQNRRGFSPYVECSACGWTARCPHCNVTLALHKSAGRLICHYCGHSESVPDRCPACRTADLSPMGFGTEKIEQEIARLFPEARVARLDRDSAASERAFRETIARFERGETDILVGTQMITKGFDFGGVSLVGILNADNLVNAPDFRAAERAFQLITQVAGRAGRRDDLGEAVIQTSDPTNPVIRQAAAGDYEAMARTQLAERAEFFYPPYARLTALTLRHRDPAVLRDAARHLGERLRGRFGRRLLGPIAPPVDRIRGEYLAGLLLKIESGASTARAREILKDELKAFAALPQFKSVTVVCNVDPQ